MENWPQRTPLCHLSLDVWLSHLLPLIAFAPGSFWSYGVYADLVNVVSSYLVYLTAMAWTGEKITCWFNEVIYLIRTI